MHKLIYVFDKDMQKDDHLNLGGFFVSLFLNPGDA